MEKSFSEKAAAAGIETKTIKFNPDERDFRGHLLKLWDYKPDAYLVLTFQPTFEILLKRIHETGTKAIVTAVEGFNYLDNLKGYDGYFYVEGDQMTDSFKEKYLAETGNPAIGYNGNGYDEMDLIIYAYETAGAKLGRKPTTAEAADVLRTLKNYPGAIGSLTMGANRVIESPAVLKYIENGKADVVTIDELKKKLER
jgi:ABC-type branched-subunit amino acid transport system substrate-binding protein